MGFLEGSGKYLEYMVLGFGVIFGVMTIFILRLAIRFRSLKREMELLDELEAEEQA